jgi:hypothetical protein
METRTDSLNGSEDGLPTKAAARFLGVVPATLERWRWLGRGPAYAKPGGKRVVYRRSELERFLGDSTITPMGKPKGMAS